MKICVLGLWHLGTVTAAGLARLGHEVVGLDFDEPVVAGLRQGRPPLFEPGLAELVAEGLAAGRLTFTTDAEQAVSGADVVWVAYDTPVDDEDRADGAYVRERAARVFPFLRDGAIMLVSSQLPVGSVGALGELFAAGADGRRCHFCASPENLRLGQAIDVFLHPDRIVVGVADEEARGAIQPLIDSIGAPCEWMSVESAEMVKHAINSFLAVSIVFANEIAAVCEQVGADAREVARGLKSESRIGRRAYVTPGGPFAGGTLARDIGFLTTIATEQNLALPLLASVRPSNDAHRSWAARALERTLGTLSGTSIGILGLTYKAGTDTLRRSAAIELAGWLSAKGCRVRGYDPAIHDLPPALRSTLSLCDDPLDAARGADAIVIATDLPALRDLDWAAMIDAMKGDVLVDPTGLMIDRAAGFAAVRYRAVGLALDADRRAEA